MITLGLTGSIGMGKSATASLFRSENVPVYDADASVHSLYEKGGAAVEPLGAAFIGVVRNGAVDRAALRAMVIDDPTAMQRLESIVHPLAGALQQDFREKAKTAGHSLVVLDIPLLFETGAEHMCSYTLVVTAPAEVQRARVLARPGMTEAVFETILSRQMPDSEKRARADFILSTAYGFDFAQDQVRAIVALMKRISAGVEL